MTDSPHTSAEQPVEGPSSTPAPAVDPVAQATAQADARSETRDIADVSAVEIITTATVHLMSAAAVKVGLAEDEETGRYQDLAEARKLITALAGLVTAAAPEIGGDHARSLRDGLRSLQLAFAEALPFPDAPGEGPGEKWTGRVS